MRGRIQGRVRALAMAVSVALATVALPLTIAVATAQPAHAAGPAALINTDTVSGAPSVEENLAVSAGFTATRANGAQWGALSAADFAKYQVLIIGDPTCGRLAASVTANAAVWAPVVMGTSVNTKPGNRVLIGTDPVYHRGGHPGANTLIKDGIAFAGKLLGRTGVYLDVTCSDGPDSAAVLSLLDRLSVGGGTWTENGTPPCGGSVSLIAANPDFAGLTSADLQGWSCSDHETFPKFRDDWIPLAVATDTPSRPTCGTEPSTGAAVCGEAYVLIAGTGVVVTAPDISLTPTEATNPAGTSHTVTATVTRAGSPVSGQTVSFTITGQNAGVAGVCAPPACTTDASGKVSFTYTDVNGAGDDTIIASFTDPDTGTKEQASAIKHWIGKASPAIATTPSGSVPAGGNVSDSATLSGGSSPTGTITFSLFGPGDTTCKTVIATRSAAVAGNGTYGSGNVPVAAAGTYNWVAAYGGDANNNPAASGCGDEKVVVTPQILTGRAFGVSAKTALLSVSPTPDTGSISTTAAGTTSTPCVATLSGTLVNARSLCVGVTTSQAPGTSTASATVAGADVAVPPLPAISTTDITATSKTTCAGSAGQSMIAFLKVGSTVVIPTSTTPAPNTTLNVAGVKLILNEQVPVPGGLTVNAVHVVAPLGAADLIIASATSDIHNCP